MKIHRKHRKVSEMNITPMIDIIFQLLIFFMLTSTIISSSAIQMNLPESQTADKVTVDDTILWIYKSEKITINDEAVEQAVLPDYLKKLKRDKNMNSIVIKGDQDITYQKLVKIMDICRDAGISNISLAVDPAVLND